MRYEDTNRRNTDTAGRKELSQKTKDLFKEEVAAARNREIASLLAMRGFPLSRSGGEMHWRIPGEESVSIRGNMWYSHYRGKGGDAISFVRRFFHMDFKGGGAVPAGTVRCSCGGPVQCERQEQKQLRLPSKDSSEEQVRRYLTGIRKVSADVAGYFIETGQVYQSRAEGVRQGQEQCNLVLVGMDRDGAPRQAHIKGCGSARSGMMRRAATKRMDSAIWAAADRCMCLRRQSTSCHMSPFVQKIGGKATIWR